LKAGHVTLQAAASRYLL